MKTSRQDVVDKMEERRMKDKRRKTDMDGMKESRETTYRQGEMWVRRLPVFKLMYARNMQTFVTSERNERCLIYSLLEHIALNH